MSKNTKLTFTKVMNRGEKKLVLEKIENILDYYELPTEYTKHQSNYYGNTQHVVIANGGFIKSFYRGDQYTQDDVNDLIKLMKQSGERLTKINQRIKRDAETWNGKTVIGI